MSNLINFIKENYQIIIGTILIYQLILTIFCFSTTNLIILAVIIVLVAGSIIINNFKDPIIEWFKK